MLFVEIPPYRDRTICQPAKVNFYVINGKKKRSQPQHFIYTPVIGLYLPAVLGVPEKQKSFQKVYIPNL